MQFHGGVSLSRLCVCVSACWEWIGTTLRIPRALRRLFAKIEHSEAAMATTGFASALILKQSFHHKGVLCAQSTLHRVSSNAELAGSTIPKSVTSKSNTKRVSQESSEPDSFSVRISFLQIYQDAAAAQVADPCGDVLPTGEDLRPFEPCSLARPDDLF